MLPLLTFLLLVMMVLMIVDSNQKSMLQVYTLMNQSVCSYLPDGVEFDANIEKFRFDVEMQVNDQEYVNAVLGVFAYELKDDGKLEDAIDTINERLDLMESLEIPLDPIAIIQSVKFGEDYLLWLADEEIEHSLKTAKQYEKEKLPQTPQFKDSYLYAIHVLNILDGQCRAFNSDDFVIPIESPFSITGDFKSDEYMSSIGSIHYGIDLSNRYGADLYAYHESTVEAVYKRCDADGGSLGNTCGTIDGKGHGNGNNVVLRTELDDVVYYAVYAHCKNVMVNEGDLVSAGEIIATQGNSGNSSGSHLHFEIRIGKMNFGDGNIKNLVDPHDVIDFEREEEEENE